MYHDFCVGFFENDNWVIWYFVFLMLQFGIRDSDKIKILICCICLGDRSDAANEIVECDGCGVTVHEGETILFIPC